MHHAIEDQFIEVGPVRDTKYDTIHIIGILRGKKDHTKVYLQITTAWYVFGFGICRLHFSVRINQL